MKKIIQYLFCFSIIFSCANDVEYSRMTEKEKDGLIEIFKRDLEVLNNATNSRDFDVVLSYTYPKLFEINSRQELTEFMESLFITFKDFKVIDWKIEYIHPVIKYDSHQYTMFSYQVKSVFECNNENDFDIFFQALKEDNDYKNVKKDFLNTNSIIVEEMRLMVAVSQKNFSKWKYIEWKEDLFKKHNIIPPNVLIKLKQSSNLYYSKDYQR